MGESWKEGERNFWDGRQSVTATKASSSKKKMAQPNPSNIEEMKELRGEGGSDVFTSTRHINNTPEARLVKIYERSSRILISIPKYYGIIQILSREI